MQPENKKVVVKLLYAHINESQQYPDLPHDFWTGFLDNSFDKSNWKPIGETKFLPSPPKTLTNTEPTVLSWDWNPSSELPDEVGLLVVIDSQEDPIPDANKKIFNVQYLVCNEKRIGLKKLRIVDI